MTIISTRKTRYEQYILLAEESWKEAALKHYADELSIPDTAFRSERASEIYKQQKAHNNYCLFLCAWIIPCLSLLLFMCLL